MSEHTVNATKKIENEAVAETDAGLADLIFKNIASVCFVRYSNMSRRLQGPCEGSIFFAMTFT